MVIVDIMIDANSIMSYELDWIKGNFIFLGQCQWFSSLLASSGFYINIFYIFVHI